MSETPTNCFPWWHRYSTMPKAIVASGCATVDGRVTCSPESMRAAAETKVRQAGWWPANKSLSLATYTLARYMTSEVGGGTVEERVAVAECAVNRARDWNMDINKLLLYRGARSGSYGPIHGPSGVTTAPYGRWASTSRDPNYVDLILADLVLSGQTHFNNGGDDQVGLEYTSAFPDPVAYLKKKANDGNYWVGPLPGVDHWHTFIFRNYDIDPGTPYGRFLLDRGLTAVASRARPQWGDLPICTGLGGSAVLGIGLGILVGVAGFVLARRFIRLPIAR